jgi:hypothetical protein
MVRVGKATKLTAVLADAGTSSAWEVAVRFTIPSGLRVTELSGPLATCTIGTRACTLTTLGPSRSRKIVLTVTPDKTGKQTLTAKVSASSPADPNVKNNSAKLSLTVLAASGR